MSIQIDWLVAITGDGDRRFPIGMSRCASAPDVDRLGHAVRAAEELGLQVLLAPTGTWSEDAWLVAAVLVGATRRVRLFAGFLPERVTPLLAADLMARAQRLSGGRLIVKVEPDAADGDSETSGSSAPHDAWVRTRAFLATLRRQWPGPCTVDSNGVAPALETPGGRACGSVPPVFLHADGPGAEHLAARYADVHLARGAQPTLLASAVERMRALAAAAGRELQFGIRLEVVVRYDRERARRAALRLGAARCGTSHDRRDGWFGTRWALVGSCEEVADRIEYYHCAGIERFVLSGYGRAEEAYWFSDGVVPILERRGLLVDPTIARGAQRVVVAPH
jgi:alkanesulfonate monooxygenase